MVGYVCMALNVRNVTIWRHWALKGSKLSAIQQNRLYITRTNNGL